MTTLLALLVLLACTPASPPDLCLPVQSHDGAGQVQLRSDSGTLALALETGAGNLKVFQHGAPWWRRHWTRRVETYSLWGTADKELALLSRERFSVGGEALQTFAWREQHEPIHSIASAWGGQVDAWGGLDFFFALGDTIWFDGAQICGRRTGQCKLPKDERPTVEALVAGEPKTLLVDSAMRWGRIWGYGETPVPGSVGEISFLLWPFSERKGKDRHGTGTLGTQRLDGTIGWELLSKATWHWDLCTAAFAFDTGPAEALDPELTPLQLHRYNGHARDRPYPDPQAEGPTP